MCDTRYATFPSQTMASDKVTLLFRSKRKGEFLGACRLKKADGRESLAICTWSAGNRGKSEFIRVQLSRYVNGSLLFSVHNSSSPYFDWRGEREREKKKKKSKCNVVVFHWSLSTCHTHVVVYTASRTAQPVVRNSNCFLVNCSLYES